MKRSRQKSTYSLFNLYKILEKSNKSTVTESRSVVCLKMGEGSSLFASLTEKETSNRLFHYQPQVTELVRSKTRIQSQNWVVIKTFLFMLLLKKKKHMNEQRSIQQILFYARHYSRLWEYSSGQKIKK